MLDNFDLLAKRQAIKDYVQTKAAEKVFNMFMQEATLIETMNSEQKKKPPYPITHPKYAGNALYTRSLLCRLEAAKKVGISFFNKRRCLPRAANPCGI